MEIQASRVPGETAVFDYAALAGGIGKSLASTRILGRCFIAGISTQVDGLAGLSGRRVVETMRSRAFAGLCDLSGRAAEF